MKKRTELFVRDDGGREVAGIVDILDCVPRAIAIASGCGYPVAHSECARLGRKPRHATSTSKTLAGLDPLLVGGRFVETAITERTLLGFCRYRCNPDDRYLVQVRGHLVAIVGCRMHDIVWPGLSRVKTVYRFEPTEA